MRKFYVKEILLMGKEEKKIALQPGLNVISTSAKNRDISIAGCLNAVTGGVGKAPFPDRSTYHKIRVTLSAPAGEISFEREMKEHRILVTSNIPGITSGPYANGEEGCLSLNDLWLKLIGMEGTPQIPSEHADDLQEMSWSTLMRIFAIDQKRIAQKQPVVNLEPGETQTNFLSNLYYLLTGHAWTEEDIKKAVQENRDQQEAVAGYIRQRLQELSEKKELLLKEVQRTEGADLEAETASLAAGMKEAYQSMEKALRLNQGTAKKVMENEKKLAECDLLLNRYQRLQSQYEADMKRLDLIVNGEEEMAALPEHTQCPFCGNALTPEKQDSYRAAAEAELKKTILLLKNLLEVEDEVEKEKKQLEGSAEVAAEFQEMIREMIGHPFPGEKKGISQRVQAYQGHIRAEERLHILEEDMRGLEADLQSCTDTQIQPGIYFGRKFQADMDACIREISRACGYEEAPWTFDLQTFDLKASKGEEKETCAFLNTVLALAFQKYIQEHGKFDPGFLVIDQPLQAGENHAILPDTKKALFQYLMDHSQNGQYILREDEDQLPDLAYEKSHAAVITF